MKSSIRSSFQGKRAKRGIYGVQMSAPGLTRKSAVAIVRSGLPLIVLQKSKVAEAVIFGENLKREDIGDPYCLSRVTELAYEFSVWRRGLSDHYTNIAPAVFGIIDTFRKTTFATQSP